MSNEIKVTIKQTNGAKIVQDITILSDNSVEDLKTVIEAQFNIPSGKQNLIFKGRVLFNERKLDECGLKNEDVVLLVEKLNDTTKEEQKPLQIPLQSGVGTPGVMNLDLLKQPMSGNVNLEQMEEILKRPEIAGHLDDMLNDPNVLNAMMENPAIKPMLDANPMMRNIMSNPQFMKNLLNPQTIEMMKNMQTYNPNMTGMGMNTQQPNPQSQEGQKESNQQPQLNPMINPYMMGMNTQPPQAQSQTSTQSQPNLNPNPMMNPFAMFNPYMMGMNAQPNVNPQTQTSAQLNPNQTQQQQQQPGINPMMMNPFAMYNPYLMGMNPYLMQNNPQPNPMMTNNPQISNEVLKEKYKSQIAQLKDMGFTNEEDNITALIKTEGNIDATVERLINNMK